jgi:phospholipid/cholesterol/gamma-HCH transport system substrate-binding protein
MQGHGRRFRLGLFVLGTGALFIALLVFILQNSFGRERASYFILFHENVKGMVVGSKVNFQGVPIGVVADMRFQDGKTLVELRVDPSRANLQDLTRARMDRLLVTGQVTVELEGYGQGGKSLQPGSFIEPKEDPLHALTGSLPEVVDRASGVLARLDRVLAHAEQLLGATNQQHLGAALAHAERAAQGLADRVVPAAATLLEDARGTVLAARGSAEAATASLQAIGRAEADLRAMLREGTALMGALRGPSQTALAALRVTLDDLRGLARQLKLAPDSLLFGVRQPAAPVGGER